MQQQEPGLFARKCVLKMLNQGDQNIKQNKAEFVDIETLSPDIWFNTLARILTSSSNKLLAWVLEAWKKQWPVLNEAEISTANYVPWNGPEDIPFTKIIRNALVRVASGSKEKPSSTCSL